MALPWLQAKHVSWFLWMSFTIGGPWWFAVAAWCWFMLDLLDELPFVDHCQP